MARRILRAFVYQNISLRESWMLRESRAEVMTPKAPDWLKPLGPGT
ncbi:MAG: hypothetical protein ACK6DX_20210 [Acidobacteriota bacterium]